MPAEVAMLVDAVCNRNWLGVAVAVGCFAWRAYAIGKGCGVL